MTTWAAFVAFLVKYWRPLAVVIAVAGLLYGVEQYGENRIQKKWDAAVATQAIDAAKEETEQAETTVKVVTEYVDRVKIVKIKGDTIIKEVPKYVTKEDDTRCGVIGPGFVRLWNSANEGEVPGGTGAADARAGGPGEAEAKRRPAAQ
jgi:hypothetical protein